MFAELILLTGSLVCFFFGAFSLESKLDPNDPNSTKMILSWGLDLSENEEENIKLLLQIVIFQSIFLLIMFSAVIPALFTFKKIYNGILGLLLGSFIFHGIAILYGAPIFLDVSKTYLWSLLMSSLVFLPPCTLSGVSFESFIFFSENLPSNFLEIAKIPGIFAIFGAWIGAFVIPLDWDRTWQKWPISCTYGAMIFYLLGILCMVFYRVPHMKRRSLKEE